MKLNPNNPHEFTMTIEGRPEMNYDWQAEYVKQRKDRLADAVHDYLDDSDTSILAFYNDLRDIISEMNNYHKTFADKAMGALRLVNGQPESEKTEFISEDAQNNC